MIPFSIFLEALVAGVLMGGVYALVALGLTLIYGVMKVINLAHGEFLMLSGFIAYTLFQVFGVDPLASLVIVVPLFFVFGAVVQKLLVNPIIESEALETQTLLVTMGLGFSLESIALSLWGPEYRSIPTAYSGLSITIGAVSFSFMRLLASGIALFSSTAIYFILLKTRIGKAIRACSKDREAAMSLGINYEFISMFTFGLSAALVAMAGPLLATMLVVYPAVGSIYTLKAFCIIVLGGLGSAVGAIIGGLAFGVIESMATVFLPSGYRDAVAFGLLVLLLLFKRER